MWLKIFAILLVILVTIHQGMTQTQSPKTAAVKLKMIDKILNQKEKKVKNSMEKAELAITFVIDVLNKKNDEKFANITNELKETKTYLSELKTDSNFAEKLAVEMKTWRKFKR
jgi:signal transduction histidine kinase